MAIGIIIAIVVVAGLVGIVAFSSKVSNDDLKKKKAEGKALTDENAAILAKARENLMHLRRMVMKVKNPDIHKKGNDICSQLDMTLQTLRDKQEQIPAARQFLNYYMPTIGDVITKYQRLEESGIPADDMTEKVSAYLSEAKTAMSKQYAGLFEDDKLNITVDIEAMRMTAKREGLLDDAETSKEAKPEEKDEEQKISLTL